MIEPVSRYAGGRNPDARAEEARGLAAAIDVDIIDTIFAPVDQPRPATLFGVGKVEEVGARLDLETERPELVIVDGTLSPVQHRNLEREWKAKVLDRTALILEIFGDRAQTREGRLQVELAHLTYQRSRLVRSWTHLERQRGGVGFLGGPGETQIEADRRVLLEKITGLKKQLEQVSRTRALQRAKRKRAPNPVVALVGYTNAGKSTLFNRLAGADVMAKDLLFATLDPTMRAIDLPSSERVIVSDTVGFVSDLPTQLVAAFRATLEEVLEADLILHVRDTSHPHTEEQKEDVLTVLRELGLDENDERHVIEVRNKTDLLDPDDAAALEIACRARALTAAGTIAEPAEVAVSAHTGAGLGVLIAQIDKMLTAEHRERMYDLEPREAAAAAWLYENARVLFDETADGRRRLVARLSDKAAGQFAKRFDVAPVGGEPEDEDAPRDVYEPLRAGGEA
ncbi:MAG: GTPase HflX [Pseudomonadota bacterium]